MKTLKKEDFIEYINNLIDDYEILQTGVEDRIKWNLEAEDYIAAAQNKLRLEIYQDIVKDLKEILS